MGSNLFKCLEMKEMFSYVFCERQIWAGAALAAEKDLELDRTAGFSKAYE